MLQGGPLTVNYKCFYVTPINRIITSPIFVWPFRGPHKFIYNWFWGPHLVTILIAYLCSSWPLFLGLPALGEIGAGWSKIWYGKPGWEEILDFPFFFFGWRKNEKPKRTKQRLNYDKMYLDLFCWKFFDRFYHSKSPLFETIWGICLLFFSNQPFQANLRILT